MHKNCNQGRQIRKLSYPENSSGQIMWIRSLTVSLLQTLTNRLAIDPVPAIFRSLSFLFLSRKLWPGASILQEEFFLSSIFLKVSIAIGAHLLWYIILYSRIRGKRARVLFPKYRPMCDVQFVYSDETITSRDRAEIMPREKSIWVHTWPLKWVVIKGSQSEDY